MAAVIADLLEAVGADLEMNECEIQCASSCGNPERPPRNHYA